MTILFDRAQRQGDRDFNSGRVLPAEPCPHPPGSEGRIATLAERYAAGLALWHPGDCIELPDNPGHIGRPAALAGLNVQSRFVVDCAGRAVALGGLRGLVF